MAKYRRTKIDDDFYPHYSEDDGGIICPYCDAILMPEEYVEISETIRKLENGKLQLICTSGFESDFDDDEDEEE